MKRPLVSIVTPVYNQERYVARCIESVLAQSYPEWEQIVVDDGSDDRTPEIVRSYDDPRIRYVRLPHRGLAALGETYNTALSQARGELVAVLEGDDFWPADKLEIQVPAFAEPDIFLAWGRGALVDGDGNPRGERASLLTGKRVRYLENRELLRRLARVNVLTPTVTVMARRSALDAIGGFKQSGSSLFVDLPTWLWMAASIPGRACYVNAVLGSYRVYEEQTSQRQGRRMEAEHLLVVLEMERALGAEALRAAGWDGRVRNRALFAGLLVEGSAHLRDGRHTAAAGSFWRAFVRARSPRDWLKATLGLGSALTRRDLLAAAYSVRERAASAARPHRTGSV